MSIESHGSSMKYLLDYHSGKIKPGLGIGCQLDDYLRLKKSQMTIALGHDNVGKTAWLIWMLTCHIVINKKKVIMWSGENSKGQIMRDMIQWFAGVPFKHLTTTQITKLHNHLENYVEFIDNKKLYKPEELNDIYGSSDADICLLDPFTGLDRDMTYEGNYRFLNDMRHFVNTTQKSVYITTHPTSASGRTGAVYTEGDFKGHLKLPMKSECEGGKAFVNRTDDALVIHRMPGHPTMKYYTMVSIEKIKDKETGGQISEYQSPLLFSWNSGLGFTIAGVDPLQAHRPNLNKLNKPKLL